MANQPRDTTERVYDYLCAYLEMWVQPPLEEEIAQDLTLSPREVMQALEQLENDGRLHPRSTLPRRITGVEPLP